MSDALVDYVVDDAPTSPPCDVGWLSTLLDDLLGVIGTVGLLGILDGYHDCDEIPDDARRGLDHIKELAGPPRTRSFVGLPIAPRDPGLMYIEAPLDDPANRAAYVAFAPYSIHTTHAYRGFVSSRPWWRRWDGRPQDDHPNSRWLRVAPAICFASLVVIEIIVALAGR